jgi:endonuclease YncB( thermonuclease family)
MGSTVQRGLVLVVLATVMIIALWVLLPEGEDRGSYVVSSVSSGDSITVTRGQLTQDVRLLGVRAPAVGECGFEASRDYLGDGIGGVTVTLVPGDGADVEGEPLKRYVEVQGLDAGLAQIAQSHAAADGTDHPRAAEYAEVDAATADPCA